MALHRRRSLALAAAGPGSVAGCIGDVPARGGDGAPAVADGVVHVPSWCDRVYGLDAATGETL